jgi:hypothetical protein
MNLGRFSLAHNNDLRQGMGEGVLKGAISGNTVLYVFFFTFLA